MATDEFSPVSTPVGLSAEQDPTIVIDWEASSYAWLAMLSGPRRGRLYPLRPDGTSLGRAQDSDLIVDDDDAISRFHARLVADKEIDSWRFYVQDLASANGTFVNGERISKQSLKDEDRLLVGDTTFVFKQL